MVARDAEHIVHISSVAGSQPYQGGAVYCANKAAISHAQPVSKARPSGHSHSRKQRRSRHGRNQFSIVRFRGDIDRARAVYEGMTPMTAADVAESVLFCLSRPAHVNISEVSDAGDRPSRRNHRSPSPRQPHAGSTDVPTFFATLAA